MSRGSFEIDSARLSRALDAVLPFAHRDPTRAHMHGVLVRVVRGRLNVVSTNGHIIAAWRADVLHAGPDFDAIWEIEYAKHVVKMARREKSGVATVSRDCVVVGGLSVRMTPSDEKFPPYTKVVSRSLHVRRRDGIQWIGLDPEYMRKVGKAFRVASADKGQKMHDVRTTLTGDELDPVVFDSDSAPELLIVLMPKRVAEPSCVTLSQDEKERAA